MSKIVPNLLNNVFENPENTIFSTSRILASARKKHEERRIKNHSPTSGIFPHSYYKTQNSTNSRNKKIDAGSAFDNYYKSKRAMITDFKKNTIESDLK